MRGDAREVLILRSVAKRCVSKDENARDLKGLMD
jgi:hypothetical protein